MLNIRDMDVSKNIRSIRESKNLTQLDVANILGTERSNYARLENRGENLTIKQLTDISNALGVSIYEILGQPSAIEVSTESNGELKALKEKLETTEELLKDKRKNIKLYQSFIEWVSQKFKLQYNIAALSHAQELGLLEVDHDREYNINDYGLTNEQLKQLAEKMFSYEAPDSLLNNFIAESGFIDDKWFIQGYKNISRKRKEKVSLAESINWVNGVFEFLEEE